MLRRSDVTVLIRPNHSWPVWSSLVLHAALFSVCCAIPHGPKVHDCIMVDLQMPSLASLGVLGGRHAPGPPGPKGAPAKKTVQPTLPAAPLGHEHHEQTVPAKPQAVAVTQHKASVSPAPLPSPVSRGTESAGTGKGQTGGASAQGGGAGSGTAQGSSGSSVSNSGSGGSGGSGKPFEGEFGAQGGPSYLSRVLPVYPRFARRIGKEGTVLLRLTLDEGGTLKGVELLEKAGHGFDEAALTAVQASRFRPALRHGRPVPCRALLPIRFELRD